MQLCVEFFGDLHLGLAVWCLEDTNEARTFRLIAVNPAVEQTAMAKPEELVGVKVAQAFLAMFRTPMPAVYVEVVRFRAARDLGRHDQAMCGRYTLTRHEAEELAHELGVPVEPPPVR